MRRRAFVVWSLLVCTGATHGCFREPRGDERLAQDLGRLSRQLGLPLPHNTTVLWAHDERGIDIMTQAKLRMTPAAFHQLAPLLPVPLDQLSDGPGELGPDRGNWDPVSTPGMRSGEGQLQGHALQFGYAEAGGMVTLFVMNFSL